MTEQLSTDNDFCRCVACAKEEKKRKNAQMKFERNTAAKCINMILFYEFSSWLTRSDQFDHCLN